MLDDIAAIDRNLQVFHHATYYLVCARSSSFARVYALVRKPLDLRNVTGQQRHPKYSEIILNNLLDLDDKQEDMARVAHDVAICCIGTSFSKVTKVLGSRIDVCCI